MKNLKPTVSVFIPAFNEETNIGNILTNILDQVRDNFILKNITVSLDNCTDSTQSHVRSLSRDNKLIKLIINRERKGKYYRVSEAFKKCNTDILVILDADIGLVGKDFLEKIINALITDRKAQMVSARQVPIRPGSFIGKVIYTGFKMWDNVVSEMPDTGSSHNFLGAATAYRGSFARNINIPSHILDPHLYIYLLAQKIRGFRYCNAALIIYHPLATISDYKKFMRRSIGKNTGQLKEIFGSDLVKSPGVSFRYKIIGLIKTFIQEPVYTLPALLLSVYMNKISAALNSDTTPVWGVLTSTKSQIKPISKPTVIISTYDSLKNPFYAGGGAIAIHEVARRLATDFEITVITGRYGGKQDEIIDGVLYHQIGTLWHPQIDQLVFQLSLIPQIMFRDFDIWLESFTPPFSAFLLPLFSSRPVIGLVHMLAAEDMQRKYKLPFGLVENLGLKIYSKFIVTGPYIQSKIKSLRPDAQVKLISNGVGKINCTRALEKDQFLYLGRIEIDQKGLDLLIKAFTEFKKRTSAGTKLVIAGSGEKRQLQLLENLVSVSRYKHDISLVGRVGGNSRNDLLTRSKAVVVTSRFESFSMTALEALSCGRPVLSFDIPGLSWLPETAAVKVAGFSVSGMASAMARVIGDKLYRDRMGKSGLRFAEGFTWENVSGQYRSYLNLALSNYGQKA
jgi:glycosyltransferase involved in cell wall biosynthesis